LCLFGVLIMSSEMYHGYASGSTLYAIVLNATGQVWYPTNEAFEDYGTGSRTANDYAILMTDSDSDFYYADFPDAAAATYKYNIYLQDGVTPADDDDLLTTRSIVWTGTSEAETAVAELGAVDICNQAILMGGGAEGKTLISSYLEDSPTAEKCRILYPQARNEVLSKVQPQCSLKFADLGSTLSGSSLVGAGTDWDYQVALPSDCLIPLAQVDEDDEKTEYECEIRQGNVLTNDYSNSDADGVFFKYLMKQNNAAKYPPMLINAIAVLLAAKLTPLLDPKKTGGLMALYLNEALPNALAENGAQKYTPGDKGEPSWRNARTA